MRHTAPKRSQAQNYNKNSTTENDDNEQDKHFEHVFAYSLISVRPLLVLSMTA